MGLCINGQTENVLDEESGLIILIVKNHSALQIAPFGKQLRRTWMMIVAQVFLIILLICPALLSGQALQGDGVYVNAGIGASRSDDGLTFLAASKVMQWAPMLSLGLGLRINDYLGIEAHSAIMLSDLAAHGTVLSTNEQAIVTAGHQSFVISPKLYLPLTVNSELFLRVGAGFMLSQSTVRVGSNSPTPITTSNMGYMVTIGHARQIVGRYVATLQYDFSNTYGAAGVWRGNVGLVSIGILYCLDEP
jgi:hypothetical protein